MAKAKKVKKVLDADPKLTKKVIKQAKLVAGLASGSALDEIANSTLIESSMSKWAKRLYKEAEVLEQMLQGSTDEE